MARTPCHLLSQLGLASGPGLLLAALRSLPPLILDVGVDDDIYEGLEEVEQQPDVDHLDVGGGREVGADAEEHGGQLFRLLTSFF